MATPITELPAELPCRLCHGILDRKGRRTIFRETFGLLDQLIEVIDYIPQQNDAKGKYICCFCYTKLKKLARIEQEIATKLQTLKDERHSLVIKLRLLHKSAAAGGKHSVGTQSSKKRHSIDSPTPRKLKKSLKNTPDSRVQTYIIATCMPFQPDTQRQSENEQEKDSIDKPTRRKTKTSSNQLFSACASGNSDHETPATLLQQDANKYPVVNPSTVPSGQLLVGQQLPSVCLTVPTTGVVIPASSSTLPLTGFQQVVILNNQENMPVQPNLFQYPNPNPGQLVQFPNVAPQIQNHQLPAAPSPTDKKDVVPFTEKTEVKVNGKNNSFDEKEDTPDVKREMSSKNIAKKKLGPTSEYSSAQNIAKTMNSHLYNLNSIKIEPGLHMEVEDGESPYTSCDTDCVDEDVLVNHNIFIVKKEINEMTTADDSVS